MRHWGTSKLMISIVSGCWILCDCSTPFEEHSTVGKVVYCGSSFYFCDSIVFIAIIFEIVYKM